MSNLPKLFVAAYKTDAKANINTSTQSYISKVLKKIRAKLGFISYILGFISSIIGFISSILGFISSILEEIRKFLLKCIGGLLAVVSLPFLAVTLVMTAVYNLVGLGVRTCNVNLEAKYLLDEFDILRQRFEFVNDVKESTEEDKKLKEKEFMEAVLKKWNRIVGFLHLASGVAIISLSEGLDRSWPVSATIEHYSWRPQNTSDAGQSCADVPCEICTKKAMLGDMKLDVIICLFHLLSALSHLVASDLSNNYYNTCLEKKMQPMRWLEYFFSASLMQVVIQVLCGFTDVWMLSLCAVCIAITQVFGFTTEQILYLQTEIKGKPSTQRTESANMNTTGELLLQF